MYALEEQSLIMSLAPAIITASAIVVSALLAGLYANRQIKINSSIARLRATLDLITEHETNPVFKEAHQAYLKYRQLPEFDFKKLLCSTQLGKPTPDETKDASMIQTFLNRYELVALSINRGIIDEEFYKLWFQASTINTWNDCAPAIGVLRALNNNNQLFVQWENLVHRWADSGRIVVRDAAPEKRQVVAKMIHECMGDEDPKKNA